LLMPASETMAQAANGLTEQLGEFGAACTVVPDTDQTPTYMIALDIDGTTTTEASMDVPAPTVAAITRVVEAGHHVVFSSGRSLVGILPIARAVGLTQGWMIASNGAVAAQLTPDEPGGYAVTACQTLPGDEVIAMALAEVGADELLVAVEEIGLGYAVSSRFAAGLINGHQRVAPTDELRTMDAPRIILRAPGICARLLDKVRALGLTANPAGPDHIDVTPTGLSKASAAEAIRQALRVARHRTVAVDDGVNGIEVLRWARRGVAMGHAPQAVLDAADEVTGTIDEAGLIPVLDSLLAGKAVAR